MIRSQAAAGTQGGSPGFAIKDETFRLFTGPDIFKALAHRRTGMAWRLVTIFIVENFHSPLYRILYTEYDNNLFHMEVKRFSRFLMRWYTVSTEVPMLSALTKIQSRPDLVDEVYKSLLDAISDGSLAPGTRITQEEIAESMAVSRSPVLQALRLLKKDGLVQDAPGRGIVIADMDAQWIGNLYQVRGALDALGARLAAARKIDIGTEIIAAGRLAVRDKDVKAMIEADIAFHGAIYQASGNSLIVATTQVHWAHLRRVMGAALQSPERRESIWDDHEAIANAIAAGQVELAGELCERHANFARQNLMARMQELKPEPIAVPRRRTPWQEG